ncbi:hypothetical protein [Paraburkholderia hayleyella]|uniref:hypothetical protein n=1 Tax=Paraburkholderia hayleyella TaxID=2152889 RepID=UPI0015812614|nr:hypothetical protein [Paraburkholderia hayleyella]
MQGIQSTLLSAVQAAQAEANTDAPAANASGACSSGQPAISQDSSNVAPDNPSPSSAAGSDAPADNNPSILDKLMSSLSAGMSTLLKGLLETKA